MNSQQTDDMNRTEDETAGERKNLSLPKQEPGKADRRLNTGSRATQSCLNAKDSPPRGHNGDTTQPT